MVLHPEKDTHPALRVYNPLASRLFPIANREQIQAKLDEIHNNLAYETKLEKYPYWERLFLRVE